RAMPAPRPCAPSSVKSVATPPATAPVPLPNRSSHCPSRCCATTASSRRSLTRREFSTLAACTPRSDDDANQSQRSREEAAACRGGREHSALLRALRLLQCHLPDLAAVGRRTGWPARAYLPDEADARRR